MELTALSRGLVLLTLATGLAAFILNDPASLIAAACLLAFLIARGAVFIVSAGRIAGSVCVQRKPEPVFSRQGTPVRVETTITLAPRPATEVEVEDLLPPGARLVGDREEITGNVDRNGRCTLHYSLECRASGDVGFGGVRISCKDPFFAMSLDIRCESCRGPSLHVRPRQVFDDQSTGERGERELPWYGFIHRASVRSFREFLEGDDIRTIDWKLSAKHGRLFVRQYADRDRLPRMFVFDIPDRERPLDAETFARLREAAGGALAEEISRKKEAVLMIVSGPNLVAVDEVGRGQTDITGVLAQLRPHGRIVHLYRADSRTNIACATGTEAEEGGEMQFPARLSAVAAGLRQHRTRTLFESRLRRVLRSVDTSEILVYSLAEGDCSHLAFIAREAAETARPVSITVARRPGTPLLQERLKYLGYTSMRVI